MNLQRKEDKSAFQDKVVTISRVAKVVKGGRRFSFSAVVAVGDGKNKVGFAVGKANEVSDAIRKGAEAARKNLRPVEHLDGTLPFEVKGKYRSSLVCMYPAKEGKGVIAGGAVRTVVELAGLKDIVCKVHGSKNAHNVVRATIDGLSQLMTVEECSNNRGVEIHVERKHAIEPNSTNKKNIELDTKTKEKTNG